jgi:uracil-DNA glycosylase family 4
LFIFEAPNFDDTYNLEKGRLTCDPDTDPSGRFFFDLLEHIGLAPSDVLITNSVLCLPAAKNGKYPVSSAQRRACSPWLRRLIDEREPKVVAPCGGQALEALKLISPHTFKLVTDAGRLYEWHSRLILPLYHPSVLGRISRPAAMQFKDIEVLRTVIS